MIMSQKTSSGGGSRFCWCVVITTVMAGLGTNAPAGESRTLRIYMIGNSLIDNVKYDGFQRLAESRGHTHVWGRHMTVTAHPLTGVTTEAPVKVASPLIPDAIVGEPYEFELLPAYGKAPYRWRPAPGKLPPGLRLAEDGRIEGTPSANGQFTVTVEVRDARGATATRVLNARVYEDSTPSIAEAVDSDATTPETAEQTFELRVAPPGPKVFRVRKIGGKATVDGVLDEMSWQMDKAIEKPAGGDFDNRAAFDAARDGHNLCLAFRVFDEQVETDSTKPIQATSARPCFQPNRRRAIRSRLRLSARFLGSRAKPFGDREMIIVAAGDLFVDRVYARILVEAERE